MPGTLPSSSTKPACSPTEMTVPIVSKKSVSMIAKTREQQRRREDLRDRHAAVDLLERREERREVRRADDRRRQRRDAEEQRRDRGDEDAPQDVALHLERHEHEDREQADDGDPHVRLGEVAEADERDRRSGG